VLERKDEKITLRSPTELIDQVAAIGRRGLTIQRYKGKTNEQFTKLLCNVTLSVSAHARDWPGRRLRILDPVCGRGTSLNQGLVYGFDVDGIDNPASTVTALHNLGDKAICYIEVGSAANRADVRSTSGDVRLGDVAGDASIVGVSGNVRVLSYAAGTMQVRAVSGDITVGIVQGVNLRVDAETMSGRVHSDIPLGQEPGSRGEGPDVAVTARSVSGDVLVERAAGPHVR